MCICSLMLMRTSLCRRLPYLFSRMLRHMLSWLGYWVVLLQSAGSTKWFSSKKSPVNQWELSTFTTFGSFLDSLDRVSFDGKFHLSGLQWTRPAVTEDINFPFQGYNLSGWDIPTEWWIKSQVDVQGEDIGTGLLTYPLLMASDILLYQVSDAVLCTTPYMWCSFRMKWDVLSYPPFFGSLTLFQLEKIKDSI